MLIAITVLSTEKPAPGQPAPTEEVLIPTQELIAPDNSVAVLLIGAANSDTINEAAKTHALRTIIRQLG